MLITIYSKQETDNLGLAISHPTVSCFKVICSFPIFPDESFPRITMADQSLACTYAVLMLQGSGNCDEASILAVTKAAGVTVNKQLAAQFAAFAQKTDFQDVLGNISVGGGAAPAAAAAPAAGGAAAPAKAAAKEESEEDDDFGMGGLF